MSLNTAFLIINAFLLFVVFLKVDHLIDRVNETEEFVNMLYKQFWRR